MVNYIKQKAEVGGRAVYDVGLRPLDCWDRGFESRCGQKMSVYCVCCVLCWQQLLRRVDCSFGGVCVCVCVCVI